eukprot:TRINITY_DN12063_c1_g1_i21.p1 TRINITY_DN12063_c1_g1~~TRINITY_DN12063_c1_g1_i21.p1  ORF type:complete len:651 (-),score=60.71 TRINITY_DN12063_c1_g1_i21:383-2335(-)
MSEFAGWIINEARVDYSKKESATHDYDFFSEFIVREQMTGKYLEWVIKKNDCVMISGTEKVPFLGIILEIYVKKTNVDDGLSDSDDSCEDDVRLVVNWFYRKSDIQQSRILSRVTVPNLAPNQLVLSTHKDRIRAQFVIQPCEVFFLGQGDVPPKWYDISIKNGKLTRMDMPGFFVTHYCNVASYNQITECEPLGSFRKSRNINKIMDVDSLMAKSNRRMQEMVRDQISGKFLKALAENEPLLDQRIAALTLYWKEITSVTNNRQWLVFVEEVSQQVPEFELEVLQRAIIGVVHHEILSKLSSIKLVVELLIILCILLTRQVEFLYKQVNQPSQQHFGVLSDYFSAILSSIRGSEDVRQTLRVWVTRSSWHDAVQNRLVRNETSWIFPQEVFVPFTDIVKVLKLRKRKDVGEAEILKDSKPVSGLNAGDSGVRNKGGGRGRPKLEKTMDKKPKKQTKVITSESDSDICQQNSKSAEESSQNFAGFQLTTRSENNLQIGENTTQDVGQSSSGGMFKYPTTELHLNVLTKDQLNNLRTKIVIEDQRMKVLNQLQERRQLQAKVVWQEGGMSEEGLYVLAYVPKPDFEYVSDDHKQDTFLEFVYTMDKHECVEYLQGIRFEGLWPGQNWRDCLKLQNGNSVSQWLRSMQWDDV